MATQQDAIRVYIHKQAEKESRDCGLEPEVLAVVFAHSWKQLRDTPGTKLRRLSSTPGYDFRLRIGGSRAVVSIADDASGRLGAFVHEVGPRRDVYERDAFGVRLRGFWGTGDGGSRKPNRRLVASDYRYLDPLAATVAKVPRASLHFLLQLQQQEFFDQVLPLSAAGRGGNAELVIGHGPPGSGKTLVACDLAIEALLDGHDVDVLVPSVGLVDEYERLLKSWNALASKARTDGADGQGVRIWRYPAFFARVAGVTLPFDRESRLRAWWHQVLLEPAVKTAVARASRAVGDVSDLDITERMPVLIDALLEDDTFWGDRGATTRAKDRMAPVFEGFRALLETCRIPLLERLDSAQHAGGNAIVTRSGIATMAPPESTWGGPDADGGGRPRLMIVDEAQDLAPAEWRRLLEMWFRGRKADASTRGRLVLLGDLDQRVSLVPFHWDDVKSYAVETCGLSVSRIAERQVDAASYRMRRNIADFASTAFDRRVLDQSKVRRQGRMDKDKLLTGGTVEVAVVDPQTIDVAGVLSAGGEAGVSGEYMFVIHGGQEETSPLPSRRDVFLFSARSAKGLEADRVIVVHPFHPRKPHKPEPITADEAMEFYTAVSRAREHVLLIIDEASRSLLAAAEESWGVATIRTIGEDRRALRALVERCRIRLSDEEVRNELVRQLDQITTQPGEAGETAYVRTISILARLSESPCEDLALDLVKAGQQLASADMSLFIRVRDAARDAVAASRHAHAVATLLFAGEIRVAQGVLDQMPPAAVAAWSPEWLEAVAEESCWQSWRGNLGSSKTELIWTPQLLERQVYGGTIGRINSIMWRLQRSTGS